MKIGIIGAGNVGGTLAKAWAAKSHEVMLGVRKPDDAKYQVFKNTPNIKVGTINEAASSGDIVLLAVSHKAVKSAIKAAGNLKGKILIDCTNALNAKMTGLAMGFDTSEAEQVQKLARGAKVVKAFNSTGAQNMANPDYNGVKVDAFICGNDKDAKTAVTALAEDAGFDVVDAGGLKQARLLEPLAMLWISLAYGQGMGANIAFKLMKR